MRNLRNSAILKRYIYIFLTFTLIPMIVALTSTYYIMSERMVKQIKDSELMTLNEYRNKIELVLDNLNSQSIQIAMNFVNNGVGYQDFLNMSVSDQLRVLQSSNAMLVPNDLIKSVYIVYKDQNRIIVNNQFADWSYFSDKDWLENYKSLQGNTEEKVAWLAPRNIKYQDGGVYQGVTLVRPFPIADNPKTGYVVLNIDIEKLLTNYITKIDNTYIIINEENQIIFSTDNKMKSSPSFTKKNGYSYYGDNISFSVKSSMNKWSYISLIDENKLLLPLVPVKNLIYIMLIAGCIVLILLSFIASNLLYRPIKELTDSLRQNSEHTLAKGKVKKSENEFDIIKESFINQLNQKNSMEVKLKQNKHVIHEVTIHNLLVNKSVDIDQLKDENLFIHSAKEFIVVLFEDYSKRNYESDPYYLWSNFKKIINKEINFKFRYVGVEMDPQLTAVILYFDETDVGSKSKDDIRSICTDIIRKAAEAGMNFIASGIGIPVDDAKNLYKSYDSAYTALKYRIFAKDEPIVFFEDISENKKQQSWYYPIELETNLVSAVKERNMSEIEKLISLLISKIDDNQIPPAYAKNWFNSIRDILFAIPASLGYRQEEIISEDYIDLYNELDFKKNITEIQQYYLNICSKIIEGLNNKTGNRYKNLVTDVKKYIVEHVGEDISLVSIADKFGISPTHLSSVFKQETGENFIKYVVTVKMEFAIKLITETSMTNSEIAEKIGYFNENSFYNAFKKFSGQTPNQYRVEFKRNNL